MTDELDELICKHLEIADGGRAIGFHRICVWKYSLIC
jgi:hypothetical protein